METAMQTSDMHHMALKLLQEDANKIHRLIAVQLDNLTIPSCPLYEEVLDTQMFGLSREIDFAVRAGMISREDGREILSNLERKLAYLYTVSEPKK